MLEIVPASSCYCFAVARSVPCRPCRRDLLDWTARVSEFLRLASRRQQHLVLYIFETDHGAGQFSPPKAAFVSYGGGFVSWMQPVFVNHDAFPSASLRSSGHFFTRGFVRTSLQKGKGWEMSRWSRYAGRNMLVEGQRRLRPRLPDFSPASTSGCHRAASQSDVDTDYKVLPITGLIGITA